MAQRRGPSKTKFKEESCKVPERRGTEFLLPPPAQRVDVTPNAEESTPEEVLEDSKDPQAQPSKRIVKYVFAYEAPSLPVIPEPAPIPVLKTKPTLFPVLRTKLAPIPARKTKPTPIPVLITDSTPIRAPITESSSILPLTTEPTPMPALIPEPIPALIPEPIPIPALISQPTPIPALITEPTPITQSDEFETDISVLRVSNIPDDADYFELIRLFPKAESITRPLYENSSQRIEKPIRFCYVLFNKKAHAAEGIKEMDGRVYMGFKLRVCYRTYER